MAEEITARERMREALQNKTDGAACDACLPRLEEYVAAQLNGRNYLNLFPEIASHLDGCLHCAAAYARLYRLELAAATATLPQLQQPRLPDLAFLQPAAGPPPTLPELLRTALTKLQNGVRLQLSAALLPHLQPLPSLSPTRTPSGDERYTEQLHTLDSTDILGSEIPLKLAVYRDRQQPQKCLIEVAVTPPGRAWPLLAGIVVALELPDLRREQRTNPWGVAAFDQVPVADLDKVLIEVQL
jgi:hypothetical protein